MRLVFLFLLVCCYGVAQESPAPATKVEKVLIENQSISTLDTAQYRIRVGDKLRIRNLNALEIIYPQSAGISVSGSPITTSGSINPYQTTVDRLGQIVLPHIGRIKIVGLTKAEAISEVERRYQDLINNPIFDIEILNLYVRVLGAVFKQGVIPIEEEKMTLGQVITLAGGIDFSSADRTIKLIRTTQGTQTEIEYDIRNITDPLVANIRIYEGDYVFIPPSKGSLRNVKNQRISSILQPIVISLNTVAVLLGIYLTLRN